MRHAEGEAHGRKWAGLSMASAVQLAGAVIGLHREGVPPGMSVTCAFGAVATATGKSVANRCAPVDRPASNKVASPAPRLLEPCRGPTCDRSDAVPGHVALSRHVGVDGTRRLSHATLTARCPAIEAHGT